MTIFFRGPLQMPDMGLQQAYCGAPLRWKKGTGEVLAYIEDNANFSHYCCSSPRRRYRLQSLRSDVINAYLVYQTVGCCATEPITKLARTPAISPPHCEWTI